MGSMRENGLTPSEVLQECEILDTPSEPEFDDVAQVAAAVCGCTGASLGFVDGARIWFKAALNLPVNQFPLEDSACRFVLESEQPLVIPDVLADDRTKDLALLKQFGIRFYAGAPVRCDGHVVGSICTFGPEPKSLSEAMISALDALSRQAGALLETRRSNLRLTESEKQLASALRAAELSREHAGIAARRFETLFGRLPVASFTCDTELSIFEWNRAAERLWNKGAFEAVMRPVTDVLGWSEKKGFIPEGLAKVFKGANVENYEWKTRMPDGSFRWLISSAFPLQSSRGDIVGAVCTCADVTPMKESEERLNEYSSVLEQQKKELHEANVRLQALATTDGLTGLRNHRYFQEFLENAVEQARRYKRPLSLLVADVDAFKQYNDTFGHPAGDAVLVEVGRLFENSARTSDLVARYGGEEFVFVLPETGIKGAMIAAERLRASIEQTSGFQRPITVSFGVATLEMSDASREFLIECADKALYASKTRGRNRVTHWNEISQTRTVL